MKKYIILLIMLAGLGITISSHAQTFYVKPDTYKYDDSISFTVSQVKQLKKIQGGSFYFVPDKGYRAIELYVAITNNSKNTKSIDFEKFYLVDSVNKIRYIAKYSMGEGLAGTIGRMQPTISKGETKERKLVFAFPQDTKPKLFMVNDFIYHLRYTDKPQESSGNDSSDGN